MERKTVDLHIHSGHSSDGTYSVHELFEKAAEYGMEAIIIADHDTWEAAGEAQKESKDLGIQTLPALELSCIDEGRMVHLLGYGIDISGGHTLAKLTAEIQKSRLDILLDIKENLEKEGFVVDMEQVEKLAYPQPPVITNFANAILTDPRNRDHPKLRPYQKGGTKSDQPYIHFIRDYLTAGSPCYVPEYTVDIYTGIRAVRDAKGVPVLAHPGEWFARADEGKLPLMLECGLQGIEVYTPYHNPEKTAYFRGLADKNGLLKTAGSDYHDEKKKPGHSMGMAEQADMKMFDALKELTERNRAGQEAT